MTVQQRTDRRGFLRSAGTAVLLGAVAGCLGNGSGGTGRPDSGADDGGSGLPDRVTVGMTSRPMPKFEPRLTRVAVGGTVVWELRIGDHDTTAYHPDTYGPERIPPEAEPWASPSFSSVGETYERTFDVPGVYDYVDTEAVCTAHEQIGNVGRIVVGEPELDPGAEPALRPPQEELPTIARDRLEEFNDRTRDLLSGGQATGATDQ
jgi:plastocyanin